MRLSGQIIWIAGVMGLTAFLSGCGDKVEAPKAGETPAVAAASASDAIAAMKVVFPEADAKGEVPVPAAGDRPARVERPVAMIAGEGGRSYLVTAKEHVETCHVCSASISVFYLQGAGDRLSVTSRHTDLYESGGWGQPGEIAALTLPRNGGIGMTDESGYTAQGCTAVNVAAYRFDEAGPKEMLDRAPLTCVMLSPAGRERLTTALRQAVGGVEKDVKGTAMAALASMRLPGARTSNRTASSVPVIGVITMPPEDC